MRMFGKYGMGNSYRNYTKKEVLDILRSYHASAEEIADYFAWVEAGFCFYENPGEVCDESGNLMNYIEGSRALQKLEEEINNGTYRI